MVSRKPIFFISSILAVGATVFTILSGAAFKSVGRIFAGLFGLLGNSIGTVIGWYEIKYGKNAPDQSLPAKADETSQPDSAAPAVSEGWQEFLAHNNNLRNKLTNWPKFIGGCCMAYSGYDTDRVSELTAGLIYMVLSAVRSSKFDSSYIVTGPAAMIPAIFLMHSGYHNRDGYQFTNGVMKLTEAIISMAVPNDTKNTGWRRQLRDNVASDRQSNIRVK